MPVSDIPSKRRAWSGALRVYSHNIWAREGDWHARRRVLTDGIRALDPDIVALQKTVVTAGYDQVDDLLDGDWHVAHSRERAADGMGISIVSRWPITAVYEPDLNLSPRTADFACTALIVEVSAPAPMGPLVVVNHFPDVQVDHERERELQTVRVVRFVADLLAHRPAHVLLAGDLDAEPDAASLRFLTGRQSLDGLSVCYRNTWDAVHPAAPGGTFVASNPVAPDHWPFERIDHILIRCGEHGGPTLRIEGCELAFAEPVDGVWASNHLGLVADFASDSSSGPLDSP